MKNNSQRKERTNRKKKEERKKERKEEKKKTRKNTESKAGHLEDDWEQVKGVAQLGRGHGAAAGTREAPSAMERGGERERKRKRKGEKRKKKKKRNKKKKKKKKKKHRGAHSPGASRCGALLVVVVAWR